MTTTINTEAADIDEVVSDVLRAAEQKTSEDAFVVPAASETSERGSQGSEEPTMSEKSDNDAPDQKGGGAASSSLFRAETAFWISAAYSVCYARFVRDSAFQRRWVLRSDPPRIIACLATALSAFYGPRSEGFTLLTGVITAVAAAAIYTDAFNYADAILQNAVFFVIPTLLERPADESWTDASLWALTLRIIADVAYDAAFV